LNTLVNLESASPGFDGQFSVGVNILGLHGISCGKIPFEATLNVSQKMTKPYQLAATDFGHQLTLPSGGFPVANRG
jgi:hypothetical protein